MDVLGLLMAEIIDYSGAGLLLWLYWLQTSVWPLHHVLSRVSEPTILIQQPWFIGVETERSHSIYGTYLITDAENDRRHSIYGTYLITDAENDRSHGS